MRRLGGRGAALWAAVLLSACTSKGSYGFHHDWPDGGSSAPTPLQSTLALPPAGQLYHGVLPAGSTQPDSDIDPGNLDAYEATVGRNVAYVYFTNNWFQSKAFPAHTAGWIRDRGAVPFIRLSIRSQLATTVTDPKYTLDNLLAGQFDEDLAAWADGAKAYGGPLVVEYGTEINGDWYPWSAPYNGGLDVAPEKFKRVYRHIVQLMRARGATNITWALHYAGQSFPEDPRNVPSAYYPGDDVVDWVGISAYGSEKPFDHRCPTFRSLVDAMLPQIQQAAPNKPFFIFEFGITANNPGCPPQPWVDGALSDMLGGRWPSLKGFSWWNEKWANDGDPNDDSDMQVQDTPDIGDTFHRTFAGPNGGKVLSKPILQ